MVELQCCTSGRCTCIEYLKTNKSIVDMRLRKIKVNTAKLRGEYPHAQIDTVGADSVAVIIRLDEVPHAPKLSLPIAKANVTNDITTALSLRYLVLKTSFVHASPGQ